MSTCIQDARYEWLQANGVAGKPTFSSGSTFFQTHANTAPEEGCTISVCTPFSGVRPSHASPISRWHLQLSSRCNFLLDVSWKS